LARRDLNSILPELQTAGYIDKEKITDGDH
jgi:hypothetical protein